MNHASPAITVRRSEKGQALVVVTITMVVLLGIGALAVDLGYLYVTRNELQNVADGAALAGARMLGHIYQGIPEADQAGFVCEPACVTSIDSMAQDVAAENYAAGASVDLPTSDVAIGQWDGDNFTQTLTRPDAVQVITRREAGTNGPVGTFFARILGFFTASANAVAVAALTGKGTATPGEVELPIGISSYFFDSRPDTTYCHQDIQFYPTNDPASCAGWTSWNYGSNDVTLRRILEEDPNYQSPGIIADSTIFAFTGGTLSNPTFDALLTLFQLKGWDTDVDHNFLTESIGGAYVKQADTLRTDYCIAGQAAGTPCTSQAVKLTVDGTRQLYPDGTPRNYHRWDTGVPVYDRGDCSNPNQTIRIVGFAQVELTDVLNAPDKLVRGTVMCNLVSPEDNRGGGGEYGVRGSIPGLVR